MISKTITFEDIECEAERLFKSEGRPVIITFDVRFVEQFDKLVEQLIK